MTEQADADTLFEFPCAFPIKAMGHSSADFVEQVWQIVQRHAPDVERSLLQTRPSRNGNYLAISITITATSRAQLDDIYHELSAHEQVVMAL